ncbi:hypothetical protein ABPG77_004720 [Micractinium sp. CCAP 211/92]
MTTTLAQNNSQQLGHRTSLKKGATSFKITTWPTGFDATRAGISDLCDLYATPVDDPSKPSPVGLRILRPGMRHYGGVKAFSGRVTTILTRDGNPLVRKTLNEEGAGRVLVIDAGANMRNAMVGDRLAEHAYQRGWAGIVINGCVRDVDEVRNFLVGIMALDSHPLKPGKRDMGQRDVPVVVGGVTINPGDYLYADEDGIIVTSKAIAVPDDAPKEKQALTIPE